MNEPIHFIESKSSEEWKTGQEVVTYLSLKSKESIEENSWILYVNERRWDNWKAKIKPRSKILVVKKNKEAPKITIVRLEDGWIVLNKPENLPTQGTLKTYEDNLYQRVRYFFLVKNQFPKEVPYVGLHHRLDRGTSGLVLMTLKRSFNKEVSELFKNRKIQKQYVCYTEPGPMAPPDHWVQEDLIARGNVKKKKFYFEVGETGDQAITEFKLIERVDGHYNLIGCRPKTGRTHQLRVQLSHKGFPILGDSVYGRKKSAPRLMLHASELKFKLKGKDYQVECEPNWPIPMKKS